MRTKSISTIHGLIAYVKQNSSWQTATIRRVIQALGFSVTGGLASLKELSTELVNCAEHGADVGFSGFIYYTETIAFFKKNRLDIIANLEQAAQELDTGIIELVQGFGVFRNTTPPASGEIGKALWENRYTDELDELYNLFAWYTLEEIANTWYRYLEENPASDAALSA